MAKEGLDESVYSLQQKHVLLKCPGALKHYLSL